jgi:FMN phosphatase YigB (HAD superfamily)
MNVAMVDAMRRARIVSACSFDVFDTFLFRACTTPDGVFERVYELSRISKICPNVSASFVQHRIQAESRARKEAKDRSGSTEVHISDIYSFFPFKLFGLDRGALNDLAATEFQAELELCRANPDMVQKYLEMNRAGYRVGFISDTYWNTQQLARLLRTCSPGLDWDFLYASCDHGSSKSEMLFATYLREHGFNAATSLHVGDNENADIRGARRHGIGAHCYPQASAALTSKLQRETATFELLCPDRPSRLDHGGRTLRRVVATQSSETSRGFQLGLTVLGPVMTAFDAYVEARRARLAQAGGRVAIGFLGRDGFLSHRIWQDTHRDAHQEKATYLEINRRVSLVGSASTLDPLCELIGHFAEIDAPIFADIIKILPPKVKAFFAECQGGIATGRELADALPDLIEASDVAEIAAGIRARLLVYLRQAIPDFDACTDLMLVDLGYAGSVQKALRRIFDCEGIAIRLHGTYLLSLDDAFDGIADVDSAEGFISDLVVTPHAKRMITRNVTLLEELCCSLEGSVRDYRGGDVLREINPRLPDQLELISDIQNGALAYANRARVVGPRYALRPDATLDVAARWAAAILGRLLLLPDDDELVLFSSVKHDVNFGTHIPVRLIETDLLKNRIIALGLAGTCAAKLEPCWLAGSFAALSPSHAYLYLLFGANRLPSNVFGEAPCGELKIGLFATNGTASMQTITAYHSGQGELRVRIPIAQTMSVATIAVPLGKLAREGILHGVVLQSGDTVDKASKNLEATRLADDRLIFAGLERNGRHYQATHEDGCLLIPVDPPHGKVAIYTIMLTSLGDERMPGRNTGI